MPSPATTFQYTVTGTAVAAATVTGVSGTTPILYGVAVTVPSDATEDVYYGTTSEVLTTTGALIPAGVTITIPNAFFNGVLANLYFIASGSQAVSGYVL
jgi:hypothetical protein